MADANVQPVPCVFRVAMRGVRNSTKRCAVEQQVDDLVARRMPALDDHRRGPIAVDPPRRLPGVVERRDRACRSGPRPRGCSASRRARAAAARRAASECRRRRAGGRRSSPPSPDRRRLRQVELLDRRGDRFDDRRGGQHAGLGRVDLDVAGDRFDLRGDQIGDEGQTAVTPTVFCAVMAVIALVP